MKVGTASACRASDQRSLAGTEQAEHVIGEKHKLDSIQPVGETWYSSREITLPPVLPRSCKFWREFSMNPGQTATGQNDSHLAQQNKSEQWFIVGTLNLGKICTIALYRKLPHPPHYTLSKNGTHQRDDHLKLHSWSACWSVKPASRRPSLQDGDGHIDRWVNPHGSQMLPRAKRRKSGLTLMSPTPLLPFKAELPEPDPLPLPLPLPFL